jgi:hypothetical protein
MGRYQRGVHFGAVGQKRGEESSKFPIANFLLQIFALLFSYFIFKQLCSIMATQNKNYF